MTTEIDLLPMPEGEAIGWTQAWSYDQMQAYARANVAVATAQLQAEVEALRAEVKRLRDVLEEAVRACRDLDDEALAREGRLACGAECAAAIEDLVAESEPLRARVEYEYEVWQDGALQAGGREADYASAQSEANHYVAMYTPDGPVEVRIYEKRLLSAAQVQSKRRRYDTGGSLSEYGIFPECDAQYPADAEVVFIDGVGAGRSSIKACRDGVQWIRVGDRVYWPLSDSDAKRLHSACCGNGSFDGPTTPLTEESKA